MCSAEGVSSGSSLRCKIKAFFTCGRESSEAGRRGGGEGEMGETGEEIGSVRRTMQDS